MSITPLILLLFSFGGAAASDAQGTECSPENLPWVGRALIARVAAEGGAGSASDTPEGEIEAFELLEDVEVVADQPMIASRGLVDSLGKLHVIVVHLPIGWLLLLVLVDLAGLGLRRPAWEKVGLPLLAGTVLVFVLAIGTGLLQAQHEVAQGRPDIELIALHRNLMFGALGCCVAALVVRWRAHRLLAGPARPVYLMLILAAAALMTVGAHQGGRFVFGDNYLPFP